MLEFWQIGQELAGPLAATMMADSIEVVLAAGKPPHVAFDETTDEVAYVLLPLDAATRPFLLAHEFGHAYHCHAHPRQSGRRELSYRGEAVALYSEGVLARRRPDLADEWQARVFDYEGWLNGPDGERARQVMDIAFRASHARGSYRSVVRRIMAGRFDADPT